MTVGGSVTSTVERKKEQEMLRTHISRWTWLVKGSINGESDKGDLGRMKKEENEERRRTRRARKGG